MKALILVDIQNDFLPGGALAAREGDSSSGLFDESQRKPTRLGAELLQNK